MTAYAIAVLGTTPGAPHPDVLTYIERVQSTFTPYGGRFLVHGKKGEWMEGEPPGGIVMIEFPDLEAAHAWYASPPTRRSSRCAPTTCPAAWCSWTECRRGTTRRVRPRPCARRRPKDPTARSRTASRSPYGTRRGRTPSSVGATGRISPSAPNVTRSMVVSRWVPSPPGIPNRW